MKWGDIFRGYNWNFLLVLIVVACFRLSLLIPFSTFGLSLVETGGIGIAFLLYNIYSKKGGEKDG